MIHGYPRIRATDCEFASFAATAAFSSAVQKRNRPRVPVPKGAA
jgi:hypothetical protein